MVISSVTPLVVILLVPDVAAKVVVSPPVAVVIPETTVKLPYKVLVELVKVPAKPVKFKLSAAVPTVTVSVPAVILKLGATDSVLATFMVLVPVAPL